MTYKEKLLSPKWQKKRLKILERDKFTCQSCGETEKTLHVHHNFYIPKNDPWQHADICFLTLCKDCHEKEREAIVYAEKTLIFLFKICGFFSEDMFRFCKYFFSVGIDFFYYYITNKKLLKQEYKKWQTLKKKTDTSGSQTK